MSEEEIKRRREEFEGRVVGAYAREGDGKRRKEKRASTSTSSPGIAAGYDQATFNSLPLVERVLHTRAFVRDLTLLARDADAFVVSGESACRLASLLKTLNKRG